MRVLLVAYDNGSYVHLFPIGLGYIASVLRRCGCDVTIYNQDLNHYPDGHLTDYLDRNKFDMLGVSVIGGYYQYRKLLSISEAVNRSANRPFYVIGGHGPAPEPEYFLRKTGADALAIGEGEITAVKLVEALSAGGDLAGVKGIAYRKGDDIFVNERQPLIENIDEIEFPAWDMFPMEHYRLFRFPNISGAEFSMSVLSGRGCTFKCNFCYRMDEGFRPRSSEAIIEEMGRLVKDYRIGYFAFQDELLMSSVKRTEEICKAMIGSGMKVKWSCNGRLNYARPEVLRLMKEAGCVFINYGIESMDDQALKNMNKALTTKIIIKGIEATLASGISPGFNIIFGNIGENREILMKGVEFLLKYDDGSQMRTIRPVTPYPGSPLYYHAIEKGLLKDVEDFYENKHLNSDLVSVNFTAMSDDEFHKCLYEANTTLIKNYFNNRLKENIENAEKLYFSRDASFRGFRQV